MQEVQGKIGTSIIKPDIKPIQYRISCLNQKFTWLGCWEQFRIKKSLDEEVFTKKNNKKIFTN